MTRNGITAPRAALLVAAITAIAVIATLGPAPARAQKSTRSDSTSEKAPAAKPAVGRPTLSRGQDRVRTLDAINIEGEIAVPQVLFITARDVRRYRDGLGLKFQLSASEAGRSAVLPSRLRVAPQQQSQKEE